MLPQFFKCVNLSLFFFIFILFKPKMLASAGFELWSLKKKANTQNHVTTSTLLIFFTKIGHFSIIFDILTNIFLAKTNKCKNDPSISKGRYSNLQPINRQSLPITTRPGLPPSNSSFTISHKRFKICLCRI